MHSSALQVQLGELDRDVLLCMPEITFRQRNKSECTRWLDTIELATIKITLEDQTAFNIHEIHKNHELDCLSGAVG